MTTPETGEFVVACEGRGPPDSLPKTIRVTTITMDGRRHDGVLFIRGTTLFDRLVHSQHAGHWNLRFPWAVVFRDGKWMALVGASFISPARASESDPTWIRVRVVRPGDKPGPEDPGHEDMKPLI